MDSDFEIVADREACLRLAMLSGNVVALTDIHDDRLVITAPDGSVIDKPLFLSVHIAGFLKVGILEYSDVKFHRIDDLVVVTAGVAFSGSFRGQPFGGKFAHTRVWSQSSGAWRVIVGHSAALSG
ncbi:DUF4440 domain-containing protein [Nostoc sp. 3335mG]|nr:DUF4440 domain-containing protein [Nostoc sp. 3335mG]